jgi:hypothetical protein
MGVKTVHTFTWGIFVLAIFAIPAVTVLGDLHSAIWLSVVVWIEVFVLIINHMRCPLTGIAERYASNRADNFDIFLPTWLARNNKLIFGTAFAAGELFLWSRFVTN